MRIAIAGVGYVGLVTAVCLADKGHEIICVDVSEERINILNSGRSPIYEQDLEKLMLANKEKLIYTTDYKNAYKSAEVIFIGVGTPEKKDGSANLSYVYEVAKEVAECIENDCVVVIKSTVPVGTNDKVELLIKDNLKNKVNVMVASNPEFLAQGTAIKDTLYASRIVIGTEHEKAEVLLLEVYKDFDVPKITTNRRSAEMIKYASNDYLALKVSYINEIANLCEYIGANIDDVSKGMGYDPRIGDKFLQAGIGFGGSCFPKDTKALHWLSTMYDKELKTVKAAIEVNEQQKFRLIKKARKYFESFQGLTIAVLGLTFKPGTDDLREAPSLVNIPVFLDEGAIVKVWDPVGFDNFKKIYDTELVYCNTIEETITDADLCFIFTEWEDIKKLAVLKYKELMKSPYVFDGRNCYQLSNVDLHCLTYESIGRVR